MAQILGLLVQKYKISKRFANIWIFALKLIHFRIQYCIEIDWRLPVFTSVQIFKAIWYSNTKIHDIII